MGDKVVTFDQPRHDARLNILISYHYCKRWPMADFLAGIFGDVLPRVYLDSGAWSAFTLGSEIKLDDYIAYVQRNKSLLWTYCNLDHMRDPEITVANQREMERQGLDPMPAFHVGEPWKYAAAYAEEYDHIAIGRIVPFTTRPKVIIPYLGKFFRTVNGQAKVHGLGVSNTRLLRLFPWTTSDSSAWGAGFRYGAMHLFDPLAGGFNNFEYRGHRELNKNMEILREHNFERWNYLEIEGSPRKPLGAIQATAYLKMNAWMARRHGNGYRFFFAGTGASDFSYVRDAALAWRAAA